MLIEKKLIGILSAERATEVVNYNYLRQYKSFYRNFLDRR